ncbi:MAG: CdaR family protein [Spirochaetia bacterium]|nr:CdaR family protein [Spirochaetia bacterium]
MNFRVLLERVLHNWPVKIISIAAALLLFFFYRISSLEERFFNVPLALTFHENYIPAEDVPETVRIIIRGRNEDIKLVLEDEIEASADFSEYDSEGRFRAPVQIKKKGFAIEISSLEIKVEPREFNLLIESLMLKKLEVVPSVIGFTEKGYELIQNFITPSSVEVYGSRSKIENLNEIFTEAIDISSKIQDFSTRVRLKKPDESLAFSGGDVVEFSASIKPVTVVRSMLGVDIIALDLDSKLKIGKFQGIYSMEIQGKMLELEKFVPDDFRFTIDCSTLKKPGQYNLPVIPDVPAGILILNYEPKEIIVNILELN